MTIDLSDAQFDVWLKRLHLANTRRAWRELTQRAEQQEWSYRDFLALLVSEATYTVASNGSGTITISSPSAGMASFRIVNSKKVAVITTDAGNPDPQLIIIGF